MKKQLCTILSACCVAALAEPFYVDISSVANCSRTDDGIANNNVGGWSDEGINDMDTYPPIPSGPQQRNNYWINFVDPATSGGKDLIALRRAEDGKPFDLPESVTVPVPNRKAKYVYYYHTAVLYNGAKWSSRENNELHPVGSYTTLYADGSKAEMPIRLGVELRPWYMGAWWDNTEDLAWPVHVAWNTYSSKWGKTIGIFGTRFVNPSPDKEIVGIEFRSAKANVQPMIFGVTLDDEDYFGDPAVKTKREGNAWGSPPKAPEDFFSKKTAEELARKYAKALELGLVKGITAVEVYRPDLLAVTVGAGLTKSMKPTAADFDAVFAKKPFKLVSKDDPKYRDGFVPEKFGRFSYEFWNGDVGPFPAETFFHHTLYIQLPEPLTEGKTYVLSGDSLEEGLTRSVEFTFGKGTPNPAIKVNQVSYFPGVKKRWAYLGWWAGDLGTVDYSQFPKFEVYAGDNRVLEGDVVRRVRKFGEDDFKLRTGEDIYEMDIAALGTGTYRIKIPGLGWSEEFSVGDKTKFHDLYYHINRVLLHQRCGQELKKPWSDRVRKACHVWTEKNGSTHVEVVPGAVLTLGGYHDAADYDCFTYHLRATQQAMDAWEMFPDKFGDDLNLPESGNGIPDILDEAHWALRWYRDTQYPDGGIHHGRCNECDSSRQGFGWDDYGFFKPAIFSNYEFAAVAATFARHYAKFDKKEADTFLEASKKAYDWALRNGRSKGKEDNTGGTWAASELYFSTKDAKYLADVKSFVGNVNTNRLWEGMNNLATHVKCTFTPAFWHYALYEDPALDPAVRLVFRNWYLKQLTQFTWGEEGGKNQMVDTPYRPKRWFSWAGGSAGGDEAEPKLRAWYLSRGHEEYKDIEEKCLEYMSVCADFQLGCNPLSRTFITGMGYRPPLHPQISYDLYSDGPLLGDPVPGYVPFGICGNRPRAGWYPGGDALPENRRYADIGAGSAEYNSEFTINETIGPNIELYSILWALVQ